MGDGSDAIMAGFLQVAGRKVVGLLIELLWNERDQADTDNSDRWLVVLPGYQY